MAAGVLLLVCSGGGIWALHWLNQKPKPDAVANAPAFVTSTPAPPSEPPKEEPPSVPDPTPVKSKPPEPKLPDDKPPVIVKPPPPPPVEEKKEIALAENLPPELEFQIVDAINAERGKTGLEPVFLDAKVSRDCQLHANRLARKAGQLDEEAERPSVLIGAEEPLTAIGKWLKESARRTLILEPRLRTVGAGFARNVEGQWYSVFDWTSGIEREPLEATTVTGAIVYPAPGQTRVPLRFPGTETPDPLPATKNKLAGYPITLTFPRGTRIEDVIAHLASKDEREVEVWLSSPAKPANPQYADAQQNTICLIAKRPLKPGMRYTVAVTARVKGKEWSAKWSFATLSAGEIHHELAGTLLRTLNDHRRRAGLQPIPLDAERSKACTAHALYLGANVPGDPTLNWNEEKPNLPGYSEAGAAIARRVSIQGGGGPVEAVTGLVDSLISRPQLLDPNLRALGLGYTPFARGGWLWVMDFHHQDEQATDIKELFYPAIDQKEVPLVYPANEVPSPIPPEAKSKEAGYAITVEFAFRVPITETTAQLRDAKGEAVEGWLSTPSKRAIAAYPQRSLCFLPKLPLKPDTRYTVTFKAELDGKPWQRTWSFTTLKEPNRFADDLDEKILARVNALRKAAGLSSVRLDAALSRGCQSHARYLSLNAKRPAGNGLAVHREDADLPGATPEGGQAAEKSVIAVVLDPQTCVDGWMATLYHRIPILTPNLERIGFGHARIGGRKWACVLDTGNGRRMR